MFKLLMKWVVNGTVVVAFLMYYSNATFGMAALMATGLTALSYLIGDQVLLRATNSLIAAICDVLLAVVYFGVLSYALGLGITWGEAFFLGLLVGVVEWVLHRYVFKDKMSVDGT
ncbi:DUF2512 family protein [Paenibacillus sp. 1P07SE]|uniref:DUF2512 family protein n=1 Tax=Paenibacillus sp. 1P07SE TaxID=3132209 RepID=UPI0039A56D00